MPLYEYFRAPDADSVRQAMDSADGNSPVGRVFDGIEAKGVDPAVVLGMLSAAIRQQPWSPDLVDDTLVWSVDVEDDGPAVYQLDTATRDTLADADDLPRVAEEWSRIEEFEGRVDPADALVFIEAMAGLARRARDAGEGLFCWLAL